MRPAGSISQIDARTFEFRDEVGEVAAAGHALVDEPRDRGRVAVVDDATMTLRGQPPRDVAAHAAESHHAQLHRRLPVGRIERGSVRHATGAGGAAGCARASNASIALPSPAVSGRISASAALISATCENACGKLPSWRFATGSYSSASRPTSFDTASSRSNSRRRLVDAALQLEILDEPEAAGEEHAFAGRQAVLALLGPIAQHEAVDDELAFDRRDGAADPRIVVRQEADHRDQQQARVECGRPVRLHERVARRRRTPSRTPRRGRAAATRASDRAAPRGRSARPSGSRGRTRPTPRSSRTCTAAGRRAAPRCSGPARARSSRGTRACAAGTARSRRRRSARRVARSAAPRSPGRTRRAAAASTAALPTRTGFERS